MEKNPITLTVLGCGTSSGVPLLFCKCKVCRSKDPKNNRLRASVWIQTEKKSFLIDSSTDLRQQALKAKIPKIDAVLYTHPHADHISGIDELRSFNFIQKSSIPVYGNLWSQKELTSRYPYIFNPGPIEGGGIPLLDFHLIGEDKDEVYISGVKFTIIRVSHGSKECLGYRIGSVAYLTDCSYIPNKSMEQLMELDLLVLDCLRIEQHPTHLNLDQSLDVSAKLKPRKTILTHLGHDFDYHQTNKRLPKGVRLAYDGLTLKI